MLIHSIGNACFLVQGALLCLVVPVHLELGQVRFILGVSGAQEMNPLSFPAPTILQSLAHTLETQLSSVNQIVSQ